MGKVFKKVTKPIAKVFDKIVPNEIKPALPYLAAVAPFMLPAGFTIGGLSSQLSRALASGAINLGSQAAQEGAAERGINPLSLALAAGSGYLSTPGAGQSLQGAQTVGTSAAGNISAAELASKYPGIDSAAQLGYSTDLSMLDKAANLGLEGLSKISAPLERATNADLLSMDFVKGAGIPVGMAASEQAYNAALDAQRDYEKELAAYNAMTGQISAGNIATRIKAITSSMTNAGFSESDIEAALRQIGLLAVGGRVGAMDGGIISTRMGYKDAGMVSPTDSDEEGIGGVIYYDEDGKPISKKEAMKLFKKQAEEEAEERENKFEGGRIGYRDAGYVGERKDSLKGGGYDSTLSFNPLEDDINSLLEDGGASAGIVSAMLRRNSGAMTAAGETAKKGLNKSTIELTKKESKYLKELISDTGGGKFKAEILEEVPSLLVKNNKLTVKQRDLNSLSKYLDDVYLSELAPSGRGANLMPPRLRSSATSDKSVIGKLFRESKSMGGLMGLKMGGMPSMEMDYRGGGFIPVGAKERADDVPARLSKNEFVMTADAVRAAGGGSVDEGARRMYQLMDALEGRKR